MQTLLAWLPTILLVVAGVIAFISREAIKKYVGEFIAHGYRVELEQLRNELAAERDAADALRRLALRGMSGRQGALHKRQLAAAHNAWIAVTEAGPLKLIASYLVWINFDAALDAVRRHPVGRDSFRALLPPGIADARKASLRVAKERPFLPDTVWALHSALIAVLTFAELRFQMLTDDTNLPRLIDESRIRAILIGVFPDRRDAIERQGASAGFDMVSDIEAMLLREIRNFADGHEQDGAEIERASRIIRAAEEARNASVRAEATAANPEIAQKPPAN